MSLSLEQKYDFHSSFDGLQDLFAVSRTAAKSPPTEPWPPTILSSTADIRYLMSLWSTIFWLISLPLNLSK